MNSNEIRKAFLDFFASKEHTVVPSAPMVIKNDPTLMFTNAGMNQFKDIFLGNSPAKFPRATDSQKCLRVSGKHNDLEEVGRDTYHHTMFEMLGNWSFGDYFKADAIAYAWEFLTEVVKLDKNRLYATVFGGDEKDKTEADEEAKQLWMRFLPADRILYGNKKDNFWEMGDTGPCGPCSEIHIDLRDDAERAKVDAVTLINKDNPLVIEIWNLVFMQFNRLASSELVPLAAKHVDTGMGFERLCMAVQGKKSNYDTDVFQPLIQKLAQLSNKKYGDDRQTDIALRVIADHLRAVSFAIADGQLPSNTGAGYVIRRILRRAIRYGYTFLGFNAPFINTLVNDLVAQMGGQFPELKAQQTLIEKVICEEETSFLKTLESGIIKFENYCSKLSGKIIDGAFAFELFDTYGFPIDLTQLLASEKELEVDMEGFQKGLAEQKQRSRAAAAVETDDWVELESDIQPTEFVGYDTLTCECKILKYRKVKAKNKSFFQIVLDKTPFYAESGGQLGDHGYLKNINENIKIENTIKENNLSVHIANTLPENLTGTFTAVVDEDLRQTTQNNHSATHLLHYALRKVLGTHVEQKGSLVAPDRLRFDFSHFAKMTTEEIAQVEKIVNDLVRKNSPLNERRAVPIEEAKKLGAMALFGEKYGDKARVIQFGDSIEFCGGTHTSATGNIGLVKIISEGAIAAGVRRIEAFTGKYAEEYVNGFIAIHDTLKAQLNTDNVEQSVNRLAAENAAMKKQLEAFKVEKINNTVALLKDKAEAVNGINVISGVKEMDADSLKQVAYQLRTTSEKLLVVFGTIDGGKPNLTVALSDDLVANGLQAGKLVREAAALIQGGGGGQPSLAQAGGKNCDGIAAAVAKVIEIATK
ncbi:MAG: alanine--tRNA ligase [Bacteroidales bacterium]|nr:alanine--tRNA ligase [Bacteroidales bacterium]